MRDELKKWCKEHENPDGENYDLYEDGLKVYTTINPRMQLYAEEAVAKHMPVLATRTKCTEESENGCGMERPRKCFGK